MNIPVIRVADGIHELGIVVNFVVFDNLTNKKSDESFSEYQEQELLKITGKLDKEVIKSDIVLEGYRNIRTKIGLSRNKYICSSEALLKFLLKKGELPQVNLLVDIYNLLSVKTHLSIGAHALDKIVQGLDFRISNGNELFIPMGSTERTKIEKGEYAYIDGGNDVLCRLDHRQCHKTRITESTRSCLLIIQGNSFTAADQITNTTNEAIQMITRYCGGTADIIDY